MHDLLGLTLVSLVVVSLIAAIVSILRRPPDDEKKDYGNTNTRSHKVRQHVRNQLRD